MRGDPCLTNALSNGYVLPLDTVNKRVVQWVRSTCRYSYKLHARDVNLNNN